jgi:alkylation response protein AidB-like acyl-CoA dehydrogenase
VFPAPSGPEVVRAELGAWVVGNWDPDLSLVEWRRRLVSSRWAVPSWPLAWHGRGWPAWADEVVANELVVLGVVGPPIGIAVGLVAPTLLAHGPNGVLERFLPPILTGEESWCQLFSEPGSGSDLAGLSTRAERDGDEWVVNGQKVWTTGAHHADFGLLLVRSDWNAPKHGGITCLILPMHQPGVQVRPLRQMNGHATFNEVFLTDVQVPESNVVGNVDGGWRVAQTTLANERRFGAFFSTRTYGPALRRAYVEARAEAEEHIKQYAWYPQRTGRSDLLLERAAAAGRRQDPVVRQAIAKVVARQKASSWTAERARVARKAGRQPGPEGSIGKLALSQLARAAAAGHSLIGGASALLAGGDAPGEGVVAEVLVSVPGQSIAGGTDEIQRNILGERVLGLPREPGSDRDRPFRELPRNG